MKNPLIRDIPIGAAIAVVALALVAGLVTGREPAREPPSTELKRIPAQGPVVQAEALDISRLKRLRGESEFHDVFASRLQIPAMRASVPITPMAAVAPPTAAPTAPALPFTYLGRMTNGDRVIVYLLKNQEMFLGEPGDTLAGDYRLESISDKAVQFVYLPLGTIQVLTVPAKP